MSAHLIYSETTTWRPRSYYIFKNKTTNKLYVGQHVYPMNESCYLGSGPSWVDHCKQNGGYNKENVELVWWDWFEEETLAQEWLDVFEGANPYYWITEEWANQVPETTATHMFQNLRSNPMKNPEIAKRAGQTLSKIQSDPVWLETVGKQKSEKISRTMNDPKWLSTVGKQKLQKTKEKFSDPVWLETVGKAMSEKRNQTKSDSEWLSTIDKQRKEKEKQTKSDPKWLEIYRKTCPHCGKTNIDPGNYKRWHGNNCKNQGTEDF